MTCVMMGCISVNANTVLLKAMEKTQENFELRSERIEFESELLKDIGEISIKYSIINNNQQNNLYPTFDYPELALEKFKEIEDELLTELKENYNLEDLSDSNWKVYKKTLDKYLNSSNKLEKYGNSNDDVKLFRAFMDFYEDDERNTEIINYIEANPLKELNNDLDLILLLPYNTPLVSSYNNNIKKTKISNKFSLMSIDDSARKGISYAREYANGRNYDYDYFDADCTNFVSQILESTGKSQTSNWWHNRDFMGGSSSF